MLGFHEDLHRDTAHTASSDRSLGLWFGLIGALVGLWPLRWHAPVRWWALALSAVFLALALAWPRRLHWPNLAWTRFGLLLGKIVNPLAMALLFLVAVVPIAVLLRLWGKHPLRLKFEPGAPSYWIPRQPPGPASGSMAKQF